METNRPASGEPFISVIVPVVNEATTLGVTLASVHTDAVPSEIIVVDGQSSDETSAIAKLAGARVIRCQKRQRAHQLNLGARNASGAVLLFVHADTVLPLGALEQIREQMRTRQVVGGAFVRRYASSSPLLRMTCFLARCRNRTIGWHLGDQAMFVQRSLFFQLGGFRDVHMFEDLDFSRRLKKLGRIITLSPGVTSSARRFQAGVAKTTLRDVRLTAKYLLHGLPVENPQAEIASLMPPSKRAASTLT